MSDDDFTPDDGDCGHDHEGEDGSFYEEQYAFDRIEREAQASRASGCLLLLLLLAFPAAGLLAWLR